VDAKTIDRWLTLLEQMFVLRRVRAWHRNDLKRLVKTPKLHFLDTGLLAALRRAGASRIQSDRSRLGNLLEGFVYSELEKQSALSPDPALISHYRDKDNVEVDFVLERECRVVGIEVKASATVKTDDTRGLKRLQEAAGGALACGIILHDGERIQRIGDQLFAMPVSQLWA
jgi:predicted AAA+ superfamily ATPase